MAYDKQGKYIDPDVIDGVTRRCPRITVCKGLQTVTRKSVGASGGELTWWTCEDCGQETAVPTPGTFPPPDPHELENGRDDWRILRTGEDYLEVAPDEHDWRL